MTTAEIVSTIATIENEIKAHQERAASYDNIAGQWQSQANSLTCNQALKKNREACQSDKDYKNRKAAENRALRDSELQQVSLKQARISQLNDEMKSMQNANENLSNQGLTADAVATIANANANAITSKVTAESEAFRMRAEAEAMSQIESDKITNDGKQKAIYIGVGIGVIVLIVVGIIVYRKYVKKRK